MEGLPSFSDDVFEESSSKVKERPVEDEPALFRPRSESPLWFEAEGAWGQPLDVLRMRAAAAYRLGDWALAARLYEEALELKPRLLELLDGLTRCRLRLGRLDAAAESLSRMREEAGTGDQQLSVWRLARDLARARGDAGEERRLLCLLPHRLEAEPSLWTELGVSLSKAPVCAQCRERLRSAALLRSLGLWEMTERTALLFAREANRRAQEALGRELAAVDDAWRDAVRQRLLGPKEGDGPAPTAFTYNSKVEEGRDENQLLGGEEERAAVEAFRTKWLHWILRLCPEQPQCAVNQL